MYFRDHILKMKAYKPPLSGRGDSGKLLLDFNERTSPLPEPVLKQLQHWCLDGMTIRYPDYGKVIEKLADYCQVDEQNVFIGNGSDQLLDCIFRAVVDPEDEVLIPTPSFSMYQQFAQLAQADIQTYSLLDENPFQQLCEQLSEKIRLVVLCQPNNPTGQIFDSIKIRKLIEDHPSVWFLVDEAYFEFSKKTVITAQQPENLIVTRTFSKAFGIAALRFGYMIASEAILEHCSKIRGPYDINQFATQAAIHLLDEKETVLSYAHEVMNISKPKLEHKLEEKGIAFRPSAANFILIQNAPDTLFQHFDNHDILVRKMSQPELKNSFRLSIGDQKSVEKSLEVLDLFNF